MPARQDGDWRQGSKSSTDAAVELVSAAPADAAGEGGGGGGGGVAALPFPAETLRMIVEGAREEEVGEQGLLE